MVYRPSAPRRPPEAAQRLGAKPLSKATILPARRLRWCSILRIPANGTRTTSTMRRRATWCARPRTRTSHGCGARRRRTAPRCSKRGFPRAYIDANRSLADIDADAHGGACPEPIAPSGKPQQGIGLVWRLARGGTPMYARKLACAEIRARIDRFWRPYHAELDASLNDRHERFGGVWHINCHSMPAVGDALSDDPGHTRADFVLGDRDGTTCDPALTRLVADSARSFGYSVAINDPYKGVEIVRKHGRPAENRHSLQIELKRTLYMDEQRSQSHDGYARLQRDLTRLAEILAGFIRERTRG